MLRGSDAVFPGHLQGLLGFRRAKEDRQEKVEEEEGPRWTATRLRKRVVVFFYALHNGCRPNERLIVAILC